MVAPSSLLNHSGTDRSLLLYPLLSPGRETIVHMAMKNDPILRNAPAPFDDHAADLILRSSDDVDFRVHRLVLILASSTLQSLFTIPQPTSAAPDSSEMTKDGKPIVHMHGVGQVAKEMVFGLGT